MYMSRREGADIAQPARRVPSSTGEYEVETINACVEGVLTERYKSNDKREFL